MCKLQGSGYKALGTIPRIKDTDTSGASYFRTAQIVLSTKVLDSPERLRDTLIHELCHAASWIISGYSDGHGPHWTRWTEQAMKRFPELSMIDRTHSYSIRTKYQYKCVDCGYTVGRHTKSLDTCRKVCGYCRGSFKLLAKGEHRATDVKNAGAADSSTSEPPKYMTVYSWGDWFSNVSKTRLWSNFCSIIYKLLHLLNIFRMERDWQRDLVYSELVYSFIFKRERRVKAIWKDFIEKGSPASGGWNAGDMLFLEGLRQWVRLSYTSSKRVFASQHLICSFRRLSHWDVYPRQSAWSWTKSPPPSVMLLPISSSGMGTFWLC